MKATAVDSDGEPIGLLLWAAQLAFLVQLEASLGPLGISTAEFRLIGEVARAGPAGVRQGELAARLGVRGPTVSAAVSRLERAALVVRRADPADPRARLVCIADGAPLGVGADLLRDIDHRLFSPLTVAERALLASLLARVVAHGSQHHG